MNTDDLKKEYEDAQFSVILKLEKKISKLEEENKHLKSLVESSVPLLPDPMSNLGIPNEGLICIMQIALLKERSTRQELTLEESRKLQIYVDVLEKIKPSGADSSNITIPETTLLQIVKNE